MVRLPLKRRLFVVYYLGKAKGNATQAARMAGFSSPTESGYRLLRNVHVREAIAEKLEKSAMDADEVLARLSGLAASDMGDFLTFRANAGDDQVPELSFVQAKKRDKLGNLKKIKKTVRTIPNLGGTPDQETTVEVELYDPIKALSLLAKFHGLTPDSANVNIGATGLPSDIVAKIAQAYASKAANGPDRPPD